MSICLIIGGAGNLACQLSRVIADRFDRLIMIDIAESPRGRLPANAVYDRADFSEEAQIRAALGKYRPNVVVHLASLLSGSCEQDRVRGWRVNANGTFFLLDFSPGTWCGDSAFREFSRRVRGKPSRPAARRRTSMARRLVRRDEDGM